MGLSIGIDVGGTNVRFGVFDGSKLSQETRINADFSSLCKSNTPAVAWQKIVELLAEEIISVKNQYVKVSAVGIGFPGFIDPNTQNILMSPNLPGLENVDLSHALSARIGMPVTVENDALAAAYGEYWLLKEQNPSVANLIYMGLGTGVGGGLVLNGKPYQGMHGVAMEVGHIITESQGRLCGCGNLGCMEQYASATGISTSYQQATGQLESAASIARLAGDGDLHAVEAYRVAGQALAQALAHIVKVIDVADVVIGGGVSAAWELLEQSFEAHLNLALIPVLKNKINVRISSAGDVAGMLGAAMLASNLV